jgi:hypothetical protein
MVSINKEDVIEKAKYIFYSLNWYDNYLRKSLDLQIKNKDKVFDIIIMELNKDDNKMIMDINDALNKKNKLELVKTLYNVDAKHRIDGEITREAFLTEFTYLQKIRGLSEFIIPIITVAISIMAIILNP